MARNGTTRLDDNGHAGPPSGRPGEPAHIVLVGQTGLDGVLATPETTELVRVRSGTDALGEVSAWRRGSKNGEQVVVLGEAIDADPALVRARRFVEALRKLDPGVRVLAVGRPLDSDAERLGSDDAFDGWLDADDPAYSSRVLLHGRRKATGPRPVEGAQPAIAPQPSQTQPSATHPKRPVEVVAPELEPAATDDRDLVQRLNTGQPIADAAVELLSRRLGVPLQLEQNTDTSAGPGRASLPGLPGRALVGPRATGEALESAAEWLAGWLVLEERLGLLARQASTDALTGAWNRRHFDETLANAIEHARAARRDVSVLVFDIDDFKRFNDEHGHEAGDEILCEVVRLLQSVIRPSDAVCRIGGDEFAVIFDDPDGPREPTSRHPSSVVDVARRFQQQVASKRFPKLGDDAPGRLTVSGGLATFPWDGLDGAALVRAADQRALEGKRQGKNAIELGPNAN